jgi:hypothetical protein
MKKPSLASLTAQAKEGSYKIAWEGKKTQAGFRVPDFTKNFRQAVAHNTRQSYTNTPTVPFGTGTVFGGSSLRAGNVRGAENGASPRARGAQERECTPTR